MDGDEALFDREEEYDAMLDRGLRLTGEGKSYFIKGRLDLLREMVPPAFSPKRILDFGCGTGDTSVALATEFPDAGVTGVDTARRAIARAAERHGGGRIDFHAVSDLDAPGAFDLCYVNGVFHHILPGIREKALARIRTALRPEGLFALFENNPWNPGTRLLMSRIPFDRDARTISPRAAASLLRSNGFVVQGSACYLFFFPSGLRVLRGLERRMRRIPIGGQYLVLARPEVVSSGPAGPAASK